MRSVRWRSSADGGLEHCVMKIAATGITAEGVIIAGSAPDDFGLRYRIVIDAEWAGLRSIHVTRLGGATTALRHDGYGGWTDGEGKARADLAKCLDMTLAGSQFALTATIKRLAWKAGKAVDLPTLAVAAPSLDLASTPVRWTAVEPGKLYLRATDGGETESIAVDDDGLVLRVGERFERV